MTFNTIDDATHFLYAQLPYFSQQPYPKEAFKLDKIKAFCAYLNDPQKTFQTIHVGGTNGKGSVSHFLSGVLQAHGYCVGLYTSPHVFRLNERIRINTDYITNEYICAFLNQHIDFITTLKPSFFELMVALSFDYFRYCKVAIGVIEVGMGGRLDSTNIIHPILSVITNISLDHTQWLGDTIGAIAYEKAGIIKPQTPVVIGEYHSESMPVFTTVAQQQNAPLHAAFAHYQWLRSDYYTTPYHHQRISIFDTQQGTTKAYILDLLGHYQHHNLITVLEAVHQLKGLGFALDDATTEDALKNTRRNFSFYGRMQLLQKDPYIYVDVAHNEGGFDEVIKFVQAHKEFKKIHFVLGFVKDKNIATIMTKLSLLNGQFYFSEFDLARGLKAHELVYLAAQHRVYGTTYHNVNEAIFAARQNIHNPHQEAIIVCGSFFLISELRITDFSA